MAKAARPKATRPKVVTLRPGNGQRITVETDPARDEAFRQITGKLFHARSTLNCIQRTIHHCDVIDASDDVTYADVALVDVLEALDRLDALLDVFGRDHLSKTRGVAS